MNNIPENTEMPSYGPQPINVELDTGDMILNMGPQHPATHGTLRLVVKLDGEKVISADPVIGYMHRGYEKLTEVRSYPQVTTLINRIDWLSSFANEVPFVSAAEKLMDVEAPERAQYIRTMLTELSRIATFLLFMGDMSLQIGGISAAFYGFRDREYILNVIESVTGGRFHPYFNRIGGVKDDLPWGWIVECTKALDIASKACDDFDKLVVGNEIFQMRTKDVGVLDPKIAKSFGVSGSNLRASGVDWDIRRDGKKYLAYDQVKFNVHTEKEGDSFARFVVRLNETRESISIVRQLIQKLPKGDVMAKVPRVIKVPAGEAWVETENPLGHMGYYVFSQGSTGPFRTKIRTASFSNVSVLPHLLKGVYVPDVVTILASLYFILGDIDR
jgi:NADH-quinone oxidoreductase subunit D